jgi:peptidoglycan-associated lipoprotein
MNLKFILLSSLVFLQFSIVSAQRDRATRARAAFDAGEYAQAIDLYKSAYNTMNDREAKAEAIFKIAECYRRINNPVQAELWYTKAIARDYNDPLVYLYLADARRMNGKYEEARADYVKYKEMAPEDPRGANGLLSCDFAIQWINNPTPYQVENMRFFNSRQHDFAPAFANEEYSVVYFTSSRDGATGKNVHGTTGQNFTDIFETRQDRKGRWSTPVPLGETINTEYEEGTPSLSSDFNTIYFTRCKFSRNKAFGCQIYTASRKDSDWGKEEALTLAPDSLVVAHPAISPDDLILYFVSDMEGGVGGKDIWMVTRSNSGSEWGEPVNMGTGINTPGDEMYPYVHPDGTLYFSSNGHVGMGGLDIFKTTKNPDGSWRVDNMGVPVNSSADDFGIVFEKEVEKGYFSSSRSARGDDDIFAFSLPPLRFTLIGVVKDEKTDSPLENALVKSVGSDGITLEIQTSRDGSFRLNLNQNTDYVFISSKEGYLNGRERETTRGLDRSQELKTTIFMTSIDKPIELPNIFYDFAKWDLRPESMVALDKLVETLNDNPHITIELGSHTDSRGSEADNLLLSQRRAQSVVNYLIDKGIANDRLVPKGYGESQPKEVDEKIAQQYSFLKEGTLLTENFINSLSNPDIQEIAHQVNRRTDFRVIRTDYKPKK